MNDYINNWPLWPKLTGTDGEVSVAERVRWELVAEAVKWHGEWCCASVIVPVADEPESMMEAYERLAPLFVQAAEAFIRSNTSAVAWLGMAPDSMVDQILAKPFFGNGTTLGQGLELLSPSSDLEERYSTVPSPVSRMHMALARSNWDARRLIVDWTTRQQEELLPSWTRSLALAVWNASLAFNDLRSGMWNAMHFPAVKEHVLPHLYSQTAGLNTILGSLVRIADALHSGVDQSGAGKAVGLVLQTASLIEDARREVTKPPCVGPYDLDNACEKLQRATACTSSILHPDTPQIAPACAAQLCFPAVVNYSGLFRPNREAMAV